MRNAEKYAFSMGIQIVSKRVSIEAPLRAKIRVRCVSADALMKMRRPKIWVHAVSAFYDGECCRLHRNAVRQRHHAAIEHAVRKRSAACKARKHFIPKTFVMHIAARLAQTLRRAQRGRQKEIIHVKYIHAALRRKIC